MATFTVEIEGRPFDVEAPDQAAAVRAARQVAAQRPNVAEDVAKSIGSGLVTGTEQLVGLPGDIRSGLEWMGDRVGDALFGKDEARDAKVREFMSRGPFGLPSFNPPTTEQVAGAQRSVTGFRPYEPQTTAGQFARTAAEFVPGAVAFGPGAGGARQMFMRGAQSPRGAADIGRNALAFGVTSGAASEGFGQFARSTYPEFEGLARIAGAFAGPTLASQARRVATPLRSRPAWQQAAQRLEAEGIPTTAGQRTGNTQFQRRETQALGGEPMADFRENQLREFTRAAMRRVGFNVDELQPQQVDDIFSWFNNQFRSMAARSSLRLSPGDMRQIDQALVDYHQWTPTSEHVRGVASMVDDLRAIFRRGGVMGGEQYSTYRSTLNDRASEIATSAAGYRSATALRGIMGVLDRAVERQLPASMQGEWQSLRRRYANFMPIAEALPSSAADTTIGGLLSPQQLLSVLKRGNDKRRYIRGWGDLNTLARDGATLLRPPNTSGTAENLFARLANKGGSMFPGVAGGGAGYAASGGDPWQAFISAMAAQGGAQALERARAGAMFTPAGRAYYSNQIFPPPDWTLMSTVPATTFGGLLAARGDR